MGVRDFYANKNILITGVTEFLGKVVLEKILRSIPDVGTIYLLIRSKEGSSFTERFRREVASSPCFDKLRKSSKNFDEYLESKIVPLAGVLVKEGLGLSDETRKILIDNVNIVIHCAATADLNARLDNAVKINVRGPMEVLRFVGQIKNLENFVYVSTCYVNSDKKGTIEERIYDIDQDPDLILKEIENLRPEQVVQRTPTFIGNFPNTLTFTFSLCERLLAKHKQNVPLTIVRLSMLGAAWRDPFPGWVDKVSTASGLYLIGGLGLIKVAKGDPSLIGDQIPIDFCANAIIVAGAKYSRNPDVTVVHCATSSANPVTWGFCTQVIKGYWNRYPPQKRVGECNFRLQKNPSLLKAEQFARRAPTLLFHKFAYSVNYPGLKRTASKSYNALLRSEQLSEQFEHFTMNEWIFLTHRLEELREFCTEEEKDIFQLDVSAIEWKKYLLNYTWGLQRFILKENIDPPTEADKADIQLITGSGGLSNYTWVWSRGSDFKVLPVLEMKNLVLQSKKLNDVIKDLVINKKSMNLGDQQFEDYLYKVAAKECDFIFSHYHINLVRGLVSMVTVVLKNAYEKIVVDEAAVEAIRNWDFKKYGPLVFMPSHRSYMDFLMLSYILFTFNVQIPQIVAAEDFLGMALIPILLRGSGAFFIRRKKAEFPEIYNAVLYEYIQRLLMTQNWLEFFVEGTRSRYGKTMAPKFGIISIIFDAVLENKIPDAHIVPVTLNYDRVFEGESFPYELLGEQKVKESLTRMIKGLNTLSMNFGKIYVEISKPFSLKGYIEKTNQAQFQGKLDPYNAQADRFQLVKTFGYEMVHQINEHLIVMPTALVASVVLAHRKGINEENLHTKIEWLIDQLQMRNVKIGAIEGRYSHISTKSSLALLDTQIHQKKDIFHIHIAAKEDYKNILMLSYYRNTLIHAFWNESIVACALSSFGQDIAWKEGVSMERLWVEVKFLNALVSKEFYLREKVTKDFLPILVDRMVKRGVLEVIKGDEVKIKVVPNGDEVMSFLCHLIWPFLESYWLTSVYLFSMRNRTSPVLMRKFVQEIQWFAESIYEERMIEFYEACSLDTIKNAVSVFKDMKAISVSKKFLDKTNATEEIVELALPEEKVKALEDHIKKFLKDSFAKSVNSPIELARKSVLLDYPFMSKL